MTPWSGWRKSVDGAVDGWDTVAQKTVPDKAAHMATQGNDDTRGIQDGTDERQMKNDVDEHKVLLQVPIYKSAEKMSQRYDRGRPQTAKVDGDAELAVFEANSDTKRVGINGVGTVMTRLGL